MTYPYGTKGAPVVGNGLGGLPRREAAGGQETAIKQITGAATAGWVVYESTTNAFAMPSPITGAIGPAAASLAGPQSLRLDTGIGTGDTSDVAFFRNGSQVFCWANGAQPSFAILDFFTGTIKAATTIETVGANVNTVAVAISPVDQQFVVAYGISSNLAPRFARISSAGTVLQTAATDSGAIVGNSDVSFSSTGEFVIAFQDNNGNAGKFVRRNASGSQLGSVTTVEASGVNQVSICHLSNDDFVIAYAASSSVKFARYNSSGTLQGAITTVQGVSAQMVSVAASTNGDFVVSYSGTSYVRFARYNSTGTLQGSITTVKAVTGTSNDVVFDADGNFVVAYNSASTAVEIDAYSSTGVSIGGQKVVEAFSGQRVRIASHPYYFGLSYSGATKRAYFSRVFPSTNYSITAICNASPAVASGGAVPISVVTKGIPTLPTSFSADFRSVGGVAVTTGAFR